MVLPNIAVCRGENLPHIERHPKVLRRNTAAKKALGYYATVRLPDGVMVIANSLLAGQEGTISDHWEYDLGKLAGMDTAKISEVLRAAFDEPQTVASERR